MAWEIDYNSGTIDGDTWYSDEFVENVPRQIKTAQGVQAFLAYATEQEIEFLKTQGSTVENFDQQITPWEIDFWGPPSEYYPDTENAVRHAPVYFRDNSEHPVAQIVYLTHDQIRQLREADLHGADLKNTTHQAVDQIPYFHRSRPRKREAPVIIEGQWIPSDNYIKKTTGTGIYQGSLSSLGNLVAMALNDDRRLYRVIDPPEKFPGLGIAKRSMPWDSLGALADKSRSISWSAGGTYNDASNPSGTKFITAAQYDKLSINLKPSYQPVPWSSGYIRQYWNDQRYTKFGSDSAIPALTGVIPRNLKNRRGEPTLGFQGNLLYYIDLQMMRLTGGDKINLDHFINMLRQALTWVEVSNRYLASLQNCEKPLEYFNANTLEEYTTQKWNHYKTGKCLVQAFRNLGKLGGYLSDGEVINTEWRGFGTEGWILRALVDNGLVDQPCGDKTIASAMIEQNITVRDVYNPDLALKIKTILGAVTNRQSLSLIQKILGTNVKNFNSPLDYMSMSQVAGLPHDSKFPDFKALGRDIYENHTDFKIGSGPEFAEMLDKIALPANPAELEKLRGPEGQALHPTISEQLRKYLPESADGGPVSILQVMGMSSGYLKETLDTVNSAIDQLYKSRYGIQIRDTLTEISRLKAKFPLSPAEAAAAKAWTPVPSKLSTIEEYDAVENVDVKLNFSGNSDIITADSVKLDTINLRTSVKKKKQREVVTRRPGPDYWEARLQEKIQEYYSILNQASMDNTDNISTIVKTINDSWTELCQNVYYEFINYERANFKSTKIGSTANRMNFAASLATYGADTGNIGIGELLKRMAKNNEIGNHIKTILGMGKNDDILGNTGSPRQSTP
jgi:hypothetical protein